MKVYIAAASTPGQIRRVRDAERVLRAAGIEVVSTWPDVVGQHGSNPCDASADQRRAWSAQDLAEVRSADVLLLLCPPDGVTTRGAWVELGYAYALERTIISSGATWQSIFFALGAEHKGDESALAHVVRLAKGTRS